MDDFHLFSSGRRARRVRTHARAMRDRTFLTWTMNVKFPVPPVSGELFCRAQLKPYFSHKAICVLNIGH
jgi:hypothetical protein